MKTKQIKKILRNNNYYLSRTSGDHGIYERNGTTRHVSIPLGNDEINKMVAKRLVKQIKEDTQRIKINSR